MCTLLHKVTIENTKQKAVKNRQNHLFIRVSDKKTEKGNNQAL